MGPGKEHDEIEEHDRYSDQRARIVGIARLTTTDLNTHRQDQCCNHRPRTHPGEIIEKNEERLLQQIAEARYQRDRTKGGQRKRRALALAAVMSVSGHDLAQEIGNGS